MQKEWDLLLTKRVGMRIIRTEKDKVCYIMYCTVENIRKGFILWPFR